MEFELTFRPSSADGTLLYSDDAGSGDFLAINLVDRYVEFRFDCGSGGATIRCLEIYTQHRPLSSHRSFLTVCCVMQERGADQPGLVARAEGDTHSEERDSPGGQPESRGGNHGGILCLHYDFLSTTRAELLLL